MQQLKVGGLGCAGWPRRCALPCSGAATRPWLPASPGAQCNFQVLVVDLTYAQPPLARCPPSFSGAVARPWPLAAISFRCDIHAMVADPCYTQPPPERCTPSSSGAAARPWPAASRGVLRDLLVLCIDLVSAKLHAVLLGSGGQAVARGCGKCPVRPPGAGRGPHTMQLQPARAIPSSGRTASACGRDGFSGRPPWRWLRT